MFKMIAYEVYFFTKYLPRFLYRKGLAGKYLPWLGESPGSKHSQPGATDAPGIAGLVAPVRIIYSKKMTRNSGR